MHHLLNRLETFGRPRVLLVGDYMLDRYIYGDIERISPEAPVPVLKTVRRESRVGGAGNVAASIPGLGGEVCCIGVVGEDERGQELKALLDEMGVNTAGLIAAADRCTTVKTRMVGLAQHRRAQQVMRMDDEQTGSLGPLVLDRIGQAIADAVARYDVLALEDYNKGVLSHDRTVQWIELAAAQSKPIIVDPALLDSYERYRGSTLLTPNRFEASRASGVEIESDADLAKATDILIDQTGAEAIVITLDKEGCYLGRAGGAGTLIPTRPRAVYDVSGAGDVVMAMIALSIAAGAPFDEACELANVAGGLEVEKFGVVPISRDEVIAEITHMLGQRGSKVLAREQLADEIQRRRRNGETIVFTNGCFDLLHMGHVRYLQQARELGTCLIVATNSDDSVRRLKGPARPIIEQAERAEMLGSLECVDFVTVFGEDTPEDLLELIRPDVLVKGGTTEYVVGRDIVERYGGRVLTLPAVEGLSTTKIIERINSTPQDKDA
ncbi:MAG: D-glycero-beta-D-manno-heptose 1-phosphate adenylyltransferase [Phycisphaerae bacterium]